MSCLLNCLFIFDGLHYRLHLTDRLTVRVTDTLSDNGTAASEQYGRRLRGRRVTERRLLTRFGVVGFGRVN